MKKKIKSERIKPLLKMVGKEVNVTCEGGWSGRVTDVVDEEYILILKNSKPLKVSIFDVRSA